MFTWTTHPSREVMTQTLRDQIAAQLSESISADGRASFAVSGGSSPAPLYQALSAEKIGWHKVSTVLVDERWVEPGEAGSNESFVEDNLLGGEAASTCLVGLKTSHDTPGEGLAEAETRLADMKWPLDVVVLGMGPDGHTASWFPHADGLDRALASDGPRLAAVRANKSEVTGDFLDRITLTKAAVCEAKLVVLMITGPVKRRVFDDADTPGPIEDLPIRSLIFDPSINLQVHWAE